MSSWAYELSGLVTERIKDWPDRIQVRLYEALGVLCKNPEVGRHYEGDGIWLYKDENAKPHIHITYGIDRTLRRVKILVVDYAVLPALEVYGFLSYSRTDREWFAKLREALRPLEECDIRFWSDQDIAGGQSWLDLILEKAADANAALLLVSQDFLRSDFIREHELGRFLARAEERSGAPFLLLWVHLASRKALEEDDLGRCLLRYQALLDPKKPLSTIRGKRSIESVLFKLREEANRAIYRGLRKL